MSQPLQNWNLQLVKNYCITDLVSQNPLLWTSKSLCATTLDVPSVVPSNENYQVVGHKCQEAAIVLLLPIMVELHVHLL